MDPIDRLGDRVRPGVRLSMRCITPDGPSDVVGLVLGLQPEILQLEDRHAQQFEILRTSVRTARIVPTIARGRNPHRDQPQVSLRPDERAQAVRLCDLLGEIDFTEVRDTGAQSASLGNSRVELRGEWIVVWLGDEADLGPLASWGARRNARNALLVRRSETA